MSLMFIIIAASATVAATLITGARIVSLKTMAKHATLIDVVFTVLMLVLFAGTLTGMLVAILAGLLMAVTLTILKKVTNFTKPTFTRPSWTFSDRWQWPLKEHPEWKTVMDVSTAQRA